jgi:hypothetical protein
MWESVASSSDGTKLVAVAWEGYVYASVDSGATWSQIGPPLSQTVTRQQWKAVASSADGTKIVIAAYEGYLYRSGDSGATWTQGGTLQNWVSVASSSDGTKLVAGSNGTGGRICTSSDSGLTWTLQLDLGTCEGGVASSSDGIKLVAAVTDGIYTSGDSGATWTRRMSGGGPVVVSADGTKIYASNEISSNFGVTWTGGGANQAWGSVASSADGTKLVAAYAGDYGYTYGYIYTSWDAGVTWRQHMNTGPLFWSSIASSTYGTSLVAVVSGPGYIYTSSGPVP